MMKSKQAIDFLNGLILGSFPKSIDATVVNQVRVIQIFSSIGIVPLSVFGALNIAEGKLGIGLIEIFIGLFLLLNQLYLRKSLNYQVCGAVVLSLLIIVMVALVVTGGVDRTGIYWIFAFPVVAYFIKGKHEGTLWILGFLAVVLSIHILSEWNFISISYSAIEVRQLVASLVILSYLIFAYYKYINDQDSNIFDLKEHKLYDRIQALQQQLERQSKEEEHQRQLVKTIDNTITQVQTKNSDLENAKLAMMNVLEDLEEERRVVAESERKVEAILASIGEGMIATNDEHKIIVANNQAQKILGYTAKELLGANYFEKVVPVTAEGKLVPINDRPFNQALKSGLPVENSTLLYLRKDKTSFPVSITASPIEIGGKQIGGIVVFRDISKEKQIDKAKTEFVSLASHQLRTPLSAIGWYVEMLLAGDAGKLAAEQIDYLKEIQHGSKRLVEMVNSLLNVSRIELGTFMVEPKPTKPIEIADAILGEVLALIEKKQLTLIKKYDKDIPIMNLDPHLLEIVLQNLVSNAVKYTPDKGTITLSMNLEKEMLEIQVADTGIGIPKDQISRIFEKLFRADNVRATDTDGTGLGLYMVKQILDEIGGKVELKSVLNKGTTITVQIPSVGMKSRKGTRRLT